MSKRLKEDDCNGVLLENGGGKADVALLKKSSAALDKRPSEPPQNDWENDLGEAEPNSSQNSVGDEAVESIVAKLDRCRLLLEPETAVCPSSQEEPEDKGCMLIQIEPYLNEAPLPQLKELISKVLSEPYSIYTYRYFLHIWPEFCMLAYAGRHASKTSLECCSSASQGGAASKDTAASGGVPTSPHKQRVLVGAVICKMDLNSHNRQKGYIAMLAVDERYRRLKIGSMLVTRAIERMKMRNCDEVVLETEVTNGAAIKLYELQGFLRERRLHRYYLNGADAFRLKLFITDPSIPTPTLITALDGH